MSRYTMDLQMRYDRILLSLLLPVFPGFTELNAQTALATAGGKISGSGGSVSLNGRTTTTRRLPAQRKRERNPCKDLQDH